MPEEENRLISSLRKQEDTSLDHNLRPLSLHEFVGQESLREKLSLFIEAARGRGDSLDHVLLYGPPGLGKTTLATIIAHELGVNIRVTSGPAIERPGDLAAILTNLNPKDVLFIDEIHRLHTTVEEILYPAMEDFALDIIIGKGPSARTLRLDLPPFTLVGATTRAGLLSSPLRDRFGVVNRLNFYYPKELQQILLRSSRLLNITLEDSGAAVIAASSRGTPRVANRLLKRVRDYAQVRADNIITAAVADEALSLLEVDSLGLDPADRRFLDTLIRKFNGGPVGLETLAAAINEESNTIEDVYEPYLMQVGMIKRTHRGRMATSSAYRHMKLPLPKDYDRPQLFED